VADRAPKLHGRDRVSEFARAPVTDFPIEAILDRLVEEVLAVGCESCQGYHFGRPMSADALHGFITETGADGGVSLPRTASAA
jgi:hypothetical protein